ncbi:hypothetical protein BGZ95_003993 [Linnemannia exigua]|uniref:Uncharacterized protein n=1 Tax=Linnemannia exigua TaxID=604196 RepID=A0AAD4H3C2_9FUNG|nr:hypothetical protein BGZ95_003993 [Linnemannia exigua]
MPQCLSLFRRTPQRLQPIEETIPGVVTYTPPKSTEHEAVVNPAATVIDQDCIVSSMAVAENNIDHRSRRTTASNPDPERSIQVYQGKLTEAQWHYQELRKVNENQHKYILELEDQLRQMKVDRQNRKKAYAEFQQYHEVQMHNFTKVSKRYEDLDRKYMDIARTLQVTEDDRSTINRQLEVVSSTIENLVIRGRGKGSANLNRVAAIQHFRNSGLLEVFPVQEPQLESFHLNLFMESAMMAILVNGLFARPLKCIFDKSKEFEEICEWVQSRGSRASTRWRQELCILIAQDGEAMARRKEWEVNKVIVELKDLVSSVYGKVDTSMSEKIKELCNIAFDLSYAMFGMESQVYPALIDFAIPFNHHYMTLANRSDPEGSVSFVVFPSFQDSNNKLYFKAKVWCTLSTPDLIVM